MKRFLSSLMLVGLCALLAPVAPAYAEGNLLLGGQQHSYSVIFRGNGEAVVYGKLVIPNTGDEAITEVQITIPDVESIEDFVAYQQILPQICRTYDRIGGSRTCTTYGDPTYTSVSQQVAQDGTYRLIEHMEDGNVFTFPLPTAIAAGATNAVVFAYRSPDYTSAWLGGTKFTFQTPSVDALVSKATVAVSVDGDMVLRGGTESSVNYGETFSSGLQMDEVGGASALSADSARAVSLIGSGEARKDASFLQAGESLTIKGVYAETWFGAYGTRIFGTLAVLALIVAGIIYLPRLWRARRGKTAPVKGATRVPVKGEHKFNIPDWALGLLGTVGLIVWTWIVINGGDWLMRLVHEDIVEVILVVLFVMIYVLVIVAPLIFAATRRGWRGAARVFVWEIGWLVVGFVLYLVIPAFFGTEQIGRGMEPPDCPTCGSY